MQLKLSLSKCLSVVIVTLSSMTLGCKTIPGLEEPTFWICDVVNVDKAVCYNVTDPTQTEIEKGMTEMLGYSCVNPRAYGDLDQHHEALHIKIEELSGGAK